MKTLLQTPRHVGVVGRLMLRRAYNAGEDVKAQQLAWKLIQKGRDLLVAQDVLIPFPWREGVEARTRERMLQILGDDSPLSRVDISFGTETEEPHPPEASKTAALEA